MKHYEGKRSVSYKEIPRAAHRCNPDWRCPVCGASPSELLERDPLVIEGVRCSMCHFPFSLSTTGSIKGVKHRPVNALNNDWLEAWRILYVGSSKSGRLTQELMEAIDDPRQVVEDRHAAMKRWKEDDPNWKAIKS